MRNLSLKTVRKFRTMAARRGVSSVARSKRGFLAAYAKAGGNLSKLSAFWKKKRAGFIKRHSAQMRKRREPLFDQNGQPTRRHLALIMWAASPSTKLSKRRNPDEQEERREQKDYWSRRGTVRTLRGRMPGSIRYRELVEWLPWAESEGTLQFKEIGNTLYLMSTRHKDIVGSYSTSGGKHVATLYYSRAKTPGALRRDQAQEFKFDTESQARKFLLENLGPRPKRRNPISGRAVKATWRPLLGHQGILVKVVGQPTPGYERMMERQDKPPLLGSRTYFRSTFTGERLGMIEKFWDAGMVESVPGSKKYTEPAGRWLFAVYLTDPKARWSWKSIGIEESEGKAINRLMIATSHGRKTTNPKKPRLGSGQRFKSLVQKLKKRGVRDPQALSAWIGRSKYGPKRFAKLSAAGRRRAQRA